MELSFEKKLNNYTAEELIKFAQGVRDASSALCIKDCERNVPPHDDDIYDFLNDFVDYLEKRAYQKIKFLERVD